MPPQEFFVIPITHVDLAWKRGRAEMSEMLEIVVIRLLDSLENDPTFKYHIEQSAHYRELAKRRPDLVERLRPFLQSGRLEMVGGMASTLENNLPNGECFVRNQQLGLEWVWDNWGVEPKTGWLLDTFGIHAQVPQLLKGFGFTALMANRFGGSHTHDLFLSRGLDGSEIPVLGWGSNAAFVRKENLCWKFCTNWDHIEECFNKADELTGNGPFAVVPYTENEMLVSRRPLQLIAQRNQERPRQKWQTATPRNFFQALEKTGGDLPVVHGDLNPEFTGCFSLRQPIRLRNRAVETRLLEAEKWAALAGLPGGQTALEDAWWELSYVQFHDVFTGSHPTVVFNDVMQTLDAIEDTANEVLHRAFGRLIASDSPLASRVETSEQKKEYAIFNGLPWHRRDTLELALPDGWQGIECIKDSSGEMLAFEVQGQTIRVGVQVPATSWSFLSLEKASAASANDADESLESVGATSLENEWIRLDLDTKHGIARLEWKSTGTVLMENAGDWLVAQADNGNFQIENPVGAEVAASSGTLHFESIRASALGQRVRMAGEFPRLSWAGEGSFLRWQAEFFVSASRPEVQLKLHLDWKGEASRVRLTLPTTLDTATGHYEIPFGVVARKPYTPRLNAKGEWPAHRFVALESAGHGIALANTGVGGVEVGGGRLYTTLLRAPKTVYAGMEIDDTSSQHGHHDYQFSLVPYEGSWSDSKLVSFAQELNHPILTLADVRVSEALAPQSLLALEPETVVLSGVKGAQDGSGDWIIRVYETAGQPTESRLQLPTCESVVLCDLREQDEEKLMLKDGNLHFHLRPFEIKTFRVSGAVASST